MTGMLAAFWKGMLVHLWQVTLFLAVLFVLERTLRKAPARVMHALWLIGLVRILIPLSPVKALLAGLLERVETPAIPGIAVIGRLIDPVRAMPENAPSGPGALNTVLIIVTSAWAFAALAILARTAVDLARSSGNSGEPLSQLADEAALKLKRACGISGVGTGLVRLTSDRLMPGVSGILIPRIVVPRELVRSLDLNGLASILAHEESHRRRRDPLRALVSRLALALFHFYPLIYPLLRRIGATAEYDCDERVLESGFSPVSYARAFTRTMRLGLEPAGLRCGAAGNDGKLLLKRFKRILEFRRYEMTFWSRSIVTLAVITLLAGFVIPAVSTADDGKRAEHGDTPPELVKTIGPEYPKRALKYGYNATVILKVTVAEDGSVADAEVLNIAAFLSDEEKEKMTEEKLEEITGAFSKASLLAVRKWEFRPGTKGGKPARMEVQVPVKFRLE